MGAEQSSSQGGRISSEIVEGLPLPDDENNKDNPTIQDCSISNSTSSEQVPSTSAGDSNQQNGRRPSLLRRLSRMGSLIVVNPGRQINTDVEDDEMYRRLQQIPDYTPIIQNKNKLSRSTEGDEIRARLDPTPLLNIGISFQSVLQESARSISDRQNELTQQIKEIDRTCDKLVKALTDRQKKFAKHAEQINRLNDIARSLTKCQSVLNDCKFSTKMLNEMLPHGERLEPFVWSEDVELVEFKK